MFQYQVIHNHKYEQENFFNKKELGEILNLYGFMVSMGEWKDYAIFINKNVVGFNIYRKASEKPLYQIIKNLHSIKKNEKFLIKDQSGVILKKSPELKNILEVINKRKLKLVK
jgi:hypothetical protein